MATLVGVVVGGCLAPWLGAVTVVLTAGVAVAVTAGLGHIAGHGAVAFDLGRLIALLAAVLVGIAVVGWWAQRAKDGLVVAGSSYDHVRAIVRSDPKPVLGGSTVEMSIDGHRWQATIAPGQSRRELRVGDRLDVSGSTVPFVTSSAFRQSHHLAGRFRLRRIEAVHGSALAYRWANTVRASLLRSAAGFAPTERTLFAGFVLGDVRSARPELTDDFRASGLSHLVVVSGQNLAFLLGGVHPLVRWLGRRSRLVPLLVQTFVVVAFVFVARFEPSVLRAALMAMLVLGTRAVGRPQPLPRVLLVTVAVLLLVDPLLVRSVGFALSVGAVAGIAVFEPRLRPRLRRFGLLGPPLAVTVAAQLGTAPCLLLVFDGVPVVSIVANLAALPLAAPIMGWGVVAGIPAGFLGAGVSEVAHIPTRLLLRAIATVAQWSASAPLGSVTTLDAAVIGVGCVLVWFRRRYRARGLDGRRVRQPMGHPLPVHQISPALVVVALLVPLGRQFLTVAGLTEQARSGTLGPAVSWWGGDRSPFIRRVDVVVISHGASASRLLQALRDQRIGSVDMVVVASGGKPQTGVVRALAHRVDVGLIVGAPGVGAVSGVRWRRALPGMVWRAGNHVVTVLGVRDRRVEIAVAGPNQRAP